MQRLRKRVVGAFVLGLTSFAVVPQALAERKIQVFDNTITLDEVLAAQKGWCCLAAFARPSVWPGRACFRRRRADVFACARGGGVMLARLGAEGRGKCGCRPERAGVAHNQPVFCVVATIAGGGRGLWCACGCGRWP